ncbi:hypothetical protein [Moorena sp. SIO3I8]|nr:hypothetical protein [Moorena sp. SIO3I8]NEO07911.1 hypothetical protein [Moorena sp. SIO3I8]
MIDKGMQQGLGALPQDLTPPCSLLPTPDSRLPIPAPAYKKHEPYC